MRSGQLRLTGAMVTAATGKIWSNGLDRGWMAAHDDEAIAFVPLVHACLARVLELSVPSVAALQGHAVAVHE